MKRAVIFCCALGLLGGLLLRSNARADWLWTPESGKWISEKNIEKKSAMLLYEQAQSFEEAGDISKAIAAHRKLIRQYPASSIAPDAQYRIAQLLETQSDYYKAFKEYEKVIANYPSYKKYNEILEREYQIGNLYLSGEKIKFLGIAMLPAVDKSIEIFESIVRTAPYSSIASRAQFNVGEAYRKVKRYGEAIPEYQKVVENYPESDLAGEARYQIGQCSYQKTLAASFDQTNTDIALQSMQTFLKKEAGSKKSVEIKQRIDELTNRKAKKSFDIAEFYNRSNSEEAAIIYYQDVIDNFPQTEYARTASKKIDELIARPTKKKYADTHKEVVDTEQKEGWLAGLWPFGPKEKIAAGAVAAAASKATPKQTKPVREQSGKKPFWAFWVKEQKPQHLAELQEEAKTPSKAASQMKLPGESTVEEEQPVTPKAGTDVETAAEGLEPDATKPVSKQPAAIRPLEPGAAETAPGLGTVQPPAVTKPLEPSAAETATELGTVQPPAASATQNTSQAQTGSGATTMPAGEKAVSPAVTAPRAAPAVLQIKSFKVEQDGSTLRLLFETNGDLEFKTFYLKEPSRVLVSFAKGVFSSLEETIPIEKLGVHSVRQHFRSKESGGAEGRPLNAVVIDLERSKEVKVYNDLDTFVIEVEKG